MANKNGGAKTPDLGSMRVPLKPWEDCGDLTFGEASEIKARTELASKVNEDLEAARKQVQHLTSVQRVILNESREFVKALVSRRGLSAEDDYNLDPEAGKLFRTASMQPVKPTDLTPVEADTGG